MKSDQVENPFTGKAMAEAYHKYRPHYHETPFKLLLKYHGSLFNSALDVACGTGQSTSSLSSISKHVIGVDDSFEMLEKAKANYPEISFQLMNAESIDFEEESFDLVNISMGIHWFNHKAFLKGVGRVLKRDGILSVDNYGFKGIISHDPKKQKLHHEFFENFLPSVKKFNNYPEDQLLVENKMQFLKELTYEKDIEMNQLKFTSFVKTMSNFLSLSPERKGEVSAEMDRVYSQIFENRSFKLGFGGRLKIFQRLA
ncbi:MAG: class I SAM-dependent methyltransferase [Halobacteriovoraceae bacterium]|nr:class I SAM-dependent methyltransferase [Halobacteriovoraceae bacterium]